MINLNKLDYDLLSSELILEKISEYQIFAYYIPGLELNTSFTSPLRNDDIPSFSVFYASKLGKILFRDFATKEKGDCFVFVSKLFGLNYYQSLQKVAFDFGLVKEGFSSDKVKKELPKNKEYKKYSSTVHLGIKSIDFTPKDLRFWSSFGISKSTLEKYNVSSCSHIFINDYIIKVDNYKSPAYAYLEYKDEKFTYKIYQPFEKKRRFISNVDKSVWQGWRQMSDTGEVLIITKSLKDVMAIAEVSSINSVSLQAETTEPKPHIISQLKQRFNKIYLLYDNDFNKEVNRGRIYGKEIASTFKIKQIEIPDEYKSKDFSDLVKNHGKQTAKQTLINLLNP